MPALVALAANAVPPSAKVDRVQEGRARRRPLIGQDLVARGIEREVLRREDRRVGAAGGTVGGRADHRAGGERRGRRVGVGALAGAEGVGAGAPAVIGEADGRAGLDVAQDHEGEIVRVGGVVADDGDVAGGKRRGHGSRISGRAGGAAAREAATRRRGAVGAYRGRDARRGTGLAGDRSTSRIGRGICLVTACFGLCSVCMGVLRQCCEGCWTVKAGPAPARDDERWSNRFPAKCLFDNPSVAMATHHEKPRRRSLDGGARSPGQVGGTVGLASRATASRPWLLSGIPRSRPCRRALPCRR